MDSFAERWAEQEFGHADLGHGSRRNRLVKMAASLARSAAGTITDSFGNSADRQGAYCFVQNRNVDPERILESMQRATVARAEGEPYVFVPVDGSSVSVVDRQKSKDFGAIGSYSQGGRGLKVLDAIAVSPAGVPLGVTALEWWNRPPKAARTGAKKTHASRKTEDKETKYWLRAIEHTHEALSGSNVRAWYQLDREADSWPVLGKLGSLGHWYTVRSSHDRRCLPGKRYLHRLLRRCRPLGYQEVTLPRAHDRPAIKVTLAIRSLTGVCIRLKDKRTNKYQSMVLNAVYAHQIDGPRQNRLSWYLLTNRPVATLADAAQVVFGYCQRWRIEDFHKCWKSGHCQVEKTQLRTSMHVKRWATILAAVAIRVERLKHLARHEPSQPATVELSPDEVEALTAFRRKNGKRTDNFDEPLTIEKAVLWLAEWGGYMGNPTKGRPPGTTVIARGMERLSFLMAGYLLAKSLQREKETD